MKDMRAKKDGEEAILREFEGYGERFLEDVVTRLKRLGESDPELAMKAMKAVLGGVKKKYVEVYKHVRVQAMVTLPPSWRIPFIACREYAYAKGWIDKNSNARFAVFCVKTVIQNLLRRMKAEDEALARREEESEQSEEGSDKSREAEKDSQR